MTTLPPKNTAPHRFEINYFEDLERRKLAAEAQLMEEVVHSSRPEKKSLKTVEPVVVLCKALHSSISRATVVPPTGLKAISDHDK